MSKSNINRALIISNFAIVIYFLAILILNHYAIDIVLIGVVRELLTLPFLIAQVVFLVLGITYLIKNRSHLLTSISVLSLAICTVLTLGSFF